MPFLSAEQRRRAIEQHQCEIRMLLKEEALLSDKLHQVQELIRCNNYAIERIMKAQNGAVDVDTLQEIDDHTRDTMMTGIRHYPIVLTTSNVPVVIRPA